MADNAGICPRCKAGLYIVAGLIVLLNGYANIWQWWVVLGGLLLGMGLLKLAMPTCWHCMNELKPKKPKKA